MSSACSEGRVVHASRIAALLALVCALLTAAVPDALAYAYLYVCASPQCSDCPVDWHCRDDGTTVLTVQADQSVNFETSGFYAGSYVEWTFQGGSITTASGQGSEVHTVTWTTPGTYLVTVTVPTPGGEIMSLAKVVVLPGAGFSAQLVARYPFDCSAPGVDVSGHDHNGTMGAAMVVDGWRADAGSPAHGHALRFDPTNNVEEFSIPHSEALDFQGAMAITAWIRPLGPHTSDNQPSDCTEGTIACKGGNYWFQLRQDNGAIEFQNEASGSELASIPIPISLFADGKLPTDGRWTHVAVVREHVCDVLGSWVGWNIRAYVNGVFIGAAPLVNDPTINTAPVNVGNFSFAGPGGCEFNGDIDELTFFAGCLGDGDIAAIAQQRASLPDTCRGSTWPPSVSLSADGSCCFDVILRDIANNPVPGALVSIGFGSCPVQWCAQQGPGVTINTVANSANTFTDANGRAHFCICATFTGACTASLYGDGLLLAALPVSGCGGNCEQSSLCDSCAGPITTDSLRFGRWDHLATGDGPEPTSPQGELAIACPDSRAFDDPSCNRCFAHTMTFPVYPDCRVVGGTLRMSLASCWNTLDNDLVTLMHHGVPIWSRAIASLAPGGHWNLGDTATVILDLCHLPTDSTTFSATPYLADGSLDVFIQDDTAVDYMELVVCRCCSGEIHGTKFQDTNRNGTRDPGESGLVGWTIRVDGPVDASVATGAGGTYAFTGLPSGIYVVSETNQPGWVNAGAAARNVDVAGASVTGVDFGNWLCSGSSTTPCVAPPRCTVGWYSFDEGTGAIAHDLASGHDGLFVGSLTWIAGKHGTAVHFPGGANYLRVNDATAPNLDFGNGSFTIDAWVRTTMPAGNTVASLLDKRDVDTGVGYHLYTYQGRLGLVVATSTGLASLSGGPVISDGLWHFVAAIVCRTPLGANSMRLFIDGHVVAQQTSSVPTGSVSNSHDLWIGQRDRDGASNFVGDVDELEFMSCCVDTAALSRVWSAGANGKCHESCYVTNVANGPYGSLPQPCLTIFNSASTPQTYHWSVAGLPAYGNCTADPADFTPNSGVVTVAAHGWQTIWLTPVLPAMQPGQSTCFMTSVVNDATGRCFSCTGRLTQPRRLWGVVGPMTGHLVGIASEATLRLHNPDTTSHTVNWRLTDEPSDADTSGGLASLNGLPPGVTATGSVTIAAGDSVPIPFSVQFEDFDPFTVHEIVLEGDLDGDGIYERLSAQPFVSQVDPGSTTSAGAPPLPDGTRLTASPNPFRRSTAVAFVLPEAGDARVEVYDVLGRLVRTLHAGRLAAGEHRLEWDTRDANGAPARGGVYFVRVRLDARMLNTKLVLMP